MDSLPIEVFRIILGQLKGDLRAYRTVSRKWNQVTSEINQERVNKLRIGTRMEMKYFVYLMSDRIQPKLFYPKLDLSLSSFDLTTIEYFSNQFGSYITEYTLKVDLWNDAKLLVILRFSPNIVSLHLKGKTTTNPQTSVDTLRQVSNFRPFPHLATIKFEDTQDMDLLLCIVENAPALRTLTISETRKEHFTNLKPNGFLQVFTVLRKSVQVHLNLTFHVLTFFDVEFLDMSSRIKNVLNSCSIRIPPIYEIFKDDFHGTFTPFENELTKFLSVHSETMETLYWSNNSYRATTFPTLVALKVLTFDIPEEKSHREITPSMLPSLHTLICRKYKTCFHFANSVWPTVEVLYLSDIVWPSDIDLMQKIAAIFSNVRKLHITCISMTEGVRTGLESLLELTELHIEDFENSNMRLFAKIIGDSELPTEASLLADSFHSAKPPGVPLFKNLRNLKVLVIYRCSLATVQAVTVASRRGDVNKLNLLRMVIYWRLENSGDYVGILSKYHRRVQFK